MTDKSNPLADYEKEIEATLKEMALCECGHPALHHWHCGDPKKPSVHECAERSEDKKWRCSCDGYQPQEGK